MTANCKRCGCPFEPEWLDALKKWSTCCISCQFRNMCDGLDLPTPPESLDKHTKHPALSKEEFLKRIHKEAK